jgi:ATP adenylyltransferase
MERLWTPWRMAYIKDAGRMEGCIFCDLPALDPSHDAESLILARGEQAFIIMNKFPYNSGHLMVSAYRHCADYAELTPQEHAAISLLTARCVRALETAYRPEGFNIGVNQGRAAGAGIADHLHMHIVPRWSGDTNYMTTIGGTKVLPETLEETFARLRPLVDASAG